MSQVTASQVKELRERTGVGMGKCKEALVEAGGNMDEAISILRKKGMASAVKKGDRDTNEGMIAFGHNDSHIGLIEVNVETDFVVQNEKFQEFAGHLVEELLHSKAADVEAFLAAPSKSSSHTIDELRAHHIQSLGENIVVNKLKMIELTSDSSWGIYSHMGGKIVALVEVAGANDVQDLAKGIAMHVAAEAPEYLNAEDIPADIIAKEEEIARSQMANKPKDIQDKIIQGKLNAFYDQVCLTRQKFVRDSSMSVAKYLENESKELGKELTIRQFIRWQVGSA